MHAAEDFRRTCVHVRKECSLEISVHGDGLGDDQRFDDYRKG